MKKIILALLIFGAVVCAPVAKAEEIGLTPDMIEQAQTDPEYKALVISYLKTLIQLLQEQLKVMIAQQNILNQIAQNATPSMAQPAPAQAQAPIQIIMNPFPFEPIVKNFDNRTLVVIIKEKFDKCTLTITDENGNVVDNSSNWNTDSDGNSRHVYDMGTYGQHAYSITCHKSGFDPSTKTGQFPTVQQ